VENAELLWHQFENLSNIGLFLSLLYFRCEFLLSISKLSFLTIELGTKYILVFIPFVSSV